MQPHLRKCFDAIASLEFGSGPRQPNDAPGGDSVHFSNDIIAMISPEGESVTFEKVQKGNDVFVFQTQSLPERQLHEEVHWYNTTLCEKGVLGQTLF